jgi:hypothetical protein
VWASSRHSSPRNVGAELRVKGVRTDQSYLAQTLRELSGAVAAFSVRGSGYD